jgi:hypothetical protein
MTLARSRKCDFNMRNDSGRCRAGGGRGLLTLTGERGAVATDAHRMAPPMIVSIIGTAGSGDNAALPAASGVAVGHRAARAAPAAAQAQGFRNVTLRDGSSFSRGFP